MASIEVSCDVEYAQIKMFGIWFTLPEIYDFLTRLDDVMLPRGWQPKDQQWWVYNRESNVRVAGPFTTSHDAGQARGILEHYDKGGKINYWVQQEK